MIQDSINSMRLALAERVSNPFVSAAIISSLISNWKMTLLIFSDVSYDQKIIKAAQLYPDVHLTLQSFVFWPLIFAIFWTFLWPLFDWLISAYWYFIKAKISSTKLNMERKKSLSEREAADLYIMFDSQESKYLEFLKERQAKTDALMKDIEKMASEIEDGKVSLIERDAVVREINAQLNEFSAKESKEAARLRDLQLERDRFRQSLDTILNNALKAKELLPGLKSFSVVINKSDNYRADESWVKNRFLQIDKNYDKKQMELLLELFLSVGLLERDSQSRALAFGERFSYEKDDFIGPYDNSPGQRHE